MLQLAHAFEEATGTGGDDRLGRSCQGARFARLAGGSGLRPRGRLGYARRGLAPSARGGVGLRPRGAHSLRSCGGLAPARGGSRRQRDGGASATPRAGARAVSARASALGQRGAHSLRSCGGLTPRRERASAFGRGGRTRCALRGAAPAARGAAACGRRGRLAALAGAHALGARSKGSAFGPGGRSLRSGGSRRQREGASAFGRRRAPRALGGVTPGARRATRYARERRLLDAVGVTKLPRYHSLVAWQRADDLFIRLHRVTREHFPADERYELTSQLRRAAFSARPTSLKELHATTPGRRCSFCVPHGRRWSRRATVCTWPGGSVT